tara:strand:- start:17556 stop:17702 length:147 start_codon:yes stop_codon:yes gene_type:complete
MPLPRQRDGTALERYPRHIITKRTKYENHKKRTKYENHKKRTKSKTTK